MITYCNANDAARMAKEYWDTKERKAKEKANELFPEVMSSINNEIISAASCGQGKCEISLLRLTDVSDHRTLNHLRWKIKDELTETLGYRITACLNEYICIVWDSDL